MARDGFGRERAQGARDGLRLLRQIIDAPAADLAETYRKLDSG